MKIHTLLPIVAALAAAALPAQIGPTNHVAFLTQPSSGKGKLTIETKDAANACPTPAALRCTSALDASGTGGIAYDARVDGYWVTDGSTLELVASNSCTRITSTAIAPNNKSATILGLAFDLPRKRLWHVEGMPGYVGLQAYDVSGFKPVRIPSMSPGKTLPGGRVTPVGADIDPGRGVVYVVTTTPALVGWANELFVLSPDLKVEVCRFGIFECRRPPDPSRGMAFDAGRDEVVVELSGGVKRLKVGDLSKCQFTDLGCCGKGGPATDIVGLTVVPGGEVKKNGKACTPSVCACPSMTASTMGGAPALGNQDFALTLGSGPVGASSFVLINGGPCSPTMLPFVCAPLQPSLAGAVVLPVGKLAGTGTCGGEQKLPLALPVDPSLAGQRICAQWLVLCTGASTLGASEGIEILLGGR